MSDVSVRSAWPSPAEEELSDVLSFEEWLGLNKEASCMVTVGTDGLKSEGIARGDIVIIERGREPGREDLVLARGEEGWQLRRMEALDDTSELKLLGVVVALIRKYR